ncbi:MAG: branched-chain amino acid ABC transporter substrate-binding protein [Chloroflexota bacterium]|jgi:branched-chain amino acid transport system substrate-binding protein|nr:branched-chain amino acid ABC transporter substrate-binding protein [Chloroflexota bacterium]MDH5243569.1 branched-chain amino acid ABC transporter substrate-binding protein [Chloroflexota bacterium]
MKLNKVGALAAVSILAFAACSSSGASSAPSAAAPSAEAPSAAPSEGAPVDDPLGTVEIQAGEPVHVAYWGVLSGPDSTLGEDSRQGVEVAIDDLGQFMGHDILLTSEDGLCTPEGGATAATKLAADSTLVGLIGSACSDEAVGGIKAITEAGLTTISPSNTRPALTAPDRDATYAGYLRTAHNDNFQGKVAAEYSYNQLGIRKAATIHDGSAYAEALVGVFEAEFTTLGGEIVASEAIAKGTTDMSTTLKTMSAAGPELIYMPMFVAESGFLVSQIPSTTGLENVKTLGADGHYSPDFLKAAGSDAVGHLQTSPNFSAFTGDYAGFLEKRAAKFGGTPLSAFHAQAYDATNMMFAALAKVAVENADGSLTVPKGALRDAIYATKDFVGLTGTLSCSATGDCGAPVIAVYEVTQADVDALVMPATPIFP